MEKKSLKTYKTWAIILAVVTMVLGLVMVFWPGISAVAICYLMGAVCIAAGIYEIIRYFDLGLIGVLFRYDLFLGIMSVLAGVLMIFDPFKGAKALMIFTGISLLVTGVESIYAIVCISRVFRSSGHQQIIDATWHDV